MATCKLKSKQVAPVAAPVRPMLAHGVKLLRVIRACHHWGHSQTMNKNGGGGGGGEGLIRV